MSELNYAPKYAQPKTKQEDLVEYISSLDTSSRKNKKTKKEQFNNFDDIVVLNALHSACKTISNRSSSITDRDERAKVQTVVTSSNLSQKLAFITANVDGITESIKKNVTQLGNAGDFTAFGEAAKVWEKTNKDIEDLAEKLVKIINANLEKGYGSPSQLRAYQYKKVNDSKDEIKKALLVDKKPVEEIAKAHSVSTGVIMNIAEEITNENLKANTEDIKAKINEGVSRADIATEYAVSKKRLATFIKDNKLGNEPAKQEKPVKKASEDKQEAEQKTDTQEVKPAA